MLTQSTLSVPSISEDAPSGGKTTCSRCDYSYPVLSLSSDSNDQTTYRPAQVDLTGTLSSPQASPPQIYQQLHQTTPPQLHQTSPPQLHQTTPPQLHQTTPPQLHQTTPPQLHQTTPPQLHQTTPPQLHQTTPPQLHQTTPPQLHQTTPPQLHQTAPAPATSDYTAPATSDYTSSVGRTILQYSLIPANFSPNLATRDLRLSEPDFLPASLITTRIFSKPSSSNLSVSLHMPQGTLTNFRTPPPYIPNLTYQQSVSGPRQTEETDYSSFLLQQCNNTSLPDLSQNFVRNSIPAQPNFRNNQVQMPLVQMPSSPTPQTSHRYYTTGAPYGSLVYVTHGKVKPRKRTAFTDAQQAQLEEAFKKKNYISTAERVQLSLDIGLSVHTVLLWYQNKRARLKKKGINSVRSD
uniref:Homeobox transcription factor HD01 n=1 Tax=Mnemiopsis leidyi TaxID=27923 RepID=E3UJY6_MNELE|nr:homeobox transcription factor HD01 [Mnemiopsis leidyi]